MAQAARAMRPGIKTTGATGATGAVLLAALVAVISAGCDKTARYTLTIGPAKAQVEVAATPEERSRGLSGRDSLGADEGMLFIFPADGEATFWMKDTRVPLSIAFITSDGRIASIVDMAPDTLDPHPSTGPVRMAIEMPQGWFARHAVRVGDSVEIPPAARITAR